MPKLSANLYGADDNNFAEGIASDALTPQKNVDENYWGDVKPDDTGDRSHGGGDAKGSAGPGRSGGGKFEGTVKFKNQGTGSDSRATTKGNHGEQG
jgi:hypothetical protein